MKLVVAIIKPHKVEAVTEALRSVEATGITISEVRGQGRQRGHSEVFRGGEYQVDFLPKVELKVLVPDSKVDAVTQAIAEAARTGQIGDGKLWVQPVDEAMRIRTGEVGDDAV